MRQRVVGWLLLPYSGAARIFHRALDADLALLDPVDPAFALRACAVRSAQQPQAVAVDDAQLGQGGVDLGRAFSPAR